MSVFITKETKKGGEKLCKGWLDGAKIWPHEFLVWVFLWSCKAHICMCFSYINMGGESTPTLTQPQFIVCGHCILVNFFKAPKFGWLKKGRPNWMTKDTKPMHFSCINTIMRTLPSLCNHIQYVYDCQEGVTYKIVTCWSGPKHSF